MGEGLTYYVVALFVAWLGWRAGFWVPGIICILAGLAIYALMQDRPVTLGLPPVADWKNDHLAQLAPPETKRPDAAALDPAHPGDLGARALERDHVRHALRDHELGHPLPAGGPRLRRSPMRACSWPIGTLAGIAGCLLYGFISDTLFAARRPPANLLFAVVELLGLVLIFFGPQQQRSC